MQSTLNLKELTKLKGKDVKSVDGEKIGSVDEIYYDPETKEPEWIGLGTGFLGTKHGVVPVQGARVTGDAINVPFSKEMVKDEPEFDETDGVISAASERTLCEYFDVGQTQFGRATRYGDTNRGRDF